MGFVNRFANTFRQQQIQRDAADELAFHQEERVREHMRRGLTEEEARLAAARQIGNITKLREEAADPDVYRWLEHVRRDAALALRTIRKAPGFAAITILSLMLGIGANTMVFTVMKHVILDSLPVPNADRLVVLHNIGRQEGHTSDWGMNSSFAYPTYQNLAAATHSVFTGILARLGARVILESQNQSQPANCELVSGNYFSLLGVSPWRGRLLIAGDNQKAGAHPVAVLSYGAWQRLFGGDPGILHRTIRLNRNPYTVIGIAPPNFHGITIDSPPDVYVPIVMKAQMTPTWDGLNDRLDHWATLIASLRPGVSMQRAQSALSVIYPPIRDLDLTVIKSPTAEFRREFARNRIDLSPGGKGYAGFRAQLEKPLLFVGVMVIVVLLITVVNIANLLIARAAARERDMAVRISIGAGKGAILRQLLTESLLLAGAGGMLGVLLAYAATPVLLKLLSKDLSESSISAHPDGTVLFAMAAITILASLAFGLLPALQSAKTDPSVALKSEGATGQAGGHLWLRRVLVGAQMVLSMLLLTGALLFTSSLNKLQHLNPGFQVDHLITFKLDPTGAGYSQERSKTFTEDLLTRMRGLHDITAVAVSTSPVLEGDEEGGDMTVEGQHVRSGEENHSLRNRVSPGYIETLQMPLLAGRALTAHDANNKVAVVNAAFAKRFLDGNDPVGRHLEMGSGREKNLTWTIVGMVADSSHGSLRERVEPLAWMPYQETYKNLRTFAFYLRTRGDEGAAMQEIRQLLHRTDASLPPFDMRTVQQVVENQLFAERGLAVLADVFAALALVLAAIGLYGVVSYSVARRQREFGVRMAVGATPAAVLGLVLRETAVLGGVSLLCAVPLIAVCGSLVRSSLYGIEPDDPLIWCLAGLTLFAVALFAGFVPAREASKIDPQVALRSS